MAAVDNAGMGKLLTKIVVTQVCMSVKMKYINVIIIFLCHCTENSQCDKMLAAKHYGQLACIKYLLCPCLDIVKSGFGGAEAQLKVA